jgi:hypothetical protein
MKGFERPTLDEAIYVLSIGLDEDPTWVDEEVATAVVEALDRVVRSAATVPAGVAQVMLRAAEHHVFRVSSAISDDSPQRLEHVIAVELAFLLGKVVARQRGYSVILSPEATQLLLRALWAMDEVATRRICEENTLSDAYRKFATGCQAGEDSSDPQSLLRVFIATPLTMIDDTAHGILLEDAEAVASELENLGFHAEVPGRDVKPSRCASEWTPTERHERERIKVLESDLVIFIAADQASWGGGKTIAWAESNLAVVQVFSRGLEPLSRMLTGSPHRASQDRYDDRDDLLRQVRTLAGRMEAVLRRHAQRRGQMQHLDRRLLSLKEQLPEPVEPIWESSMLTRERAISLLSDSVSFANGTGVELSALEDVLPPPLVQSAVRLLFGSAGMPTRLRQQHSRTRLTRNGYRGLRLAAEKHSWSQEQVDGLIEFALDPPIQAGAAARVRLTMPRDWERLYFRLFGKRT